MQVTKKKVIIQFPLYWDLLNFIWKCNINVYILLLFNLYIYLHCVLCQEYSISMKDTNGKYCLDYVLQWFMDEGFLSIILHCIISLHKCFRKCLLLFVWSFYVEHSPMVFILNNYFLTGSQNISW